MSDVTRILEQLEAGNPIASAELLPLVYKELRNLASRRLAKESDKSFQTTDLVHEVYLRLVGPNEDWDGRAHFFAAAAEAMRRILVDRARRRHRKRHGGEFNQIDLGESLSLECTSTEVLVVNDLFDQLELKHPPEANVAKLQYFGGFTSKEIGDILDISTSTAHSRWNFAKAWLYREYRKR